LLEWVDLRRKLYKTQPGRTKLPTLRKLKKRLEVLYARAGEVQSPYVVLNGILARVFLPNEPMTFKKLMAKCRRFSKNFLRENLETLEKMDILKKTTRVNTRQRVVTEWVCLDPSAIQPFDCGFLYSLMREFEALIKVKWSGNKVSFKGLEYEMPDIQALKTPL
jgi:hypothetical protein